jgi:hypothetical protein
MLPLLFFLFSLMVLSHRSVSWVRGRDSHIITVRQDLESRGETQRLLLIHQVDQETFISDDRFVSLKKNKESLWTLKVGLLSGWMHYLNRQIKYVSARDAGQYECQVSTVPKVSRWIDLVVVVPKVRDR